MAFSQIQGRAVIKAKEPDLQLQNLIAWREII